MTGSRKGAYLLVSMAAGLVSAGYLLAPKGGPDAPRPSPSIKLEARVKAEPSRAGRAAPDRHEDFIKTPPRSRVLKRSSTTNGPIKESTLKLESTLSPTELQVYFTDMLVKDWMIIRDDLTEGIGWNGVFMQVEPAEKSMAIFAVVEKIGPASGRENPTVISIMKVEDH